MQRTTRQLTGEAEEFPSDISDLPAARDSKILQLSDGDELNLTIAPVAKRIGSAVVRMLAYNGSIPGPTLKVREGSEVVFNIENQGDLEATVHWHGLRLENRYATASRHCAGSSGAIGGSARYRIRVEVSAPVPRNRPSSPRLRSRERGLTLERSSWW